VRTEASQTTIAMWPRMPWSKTKTTSLLGRVLSLVVLPWRNPGYPLLLLLLLLLPVFGCARVLALQCTCSCSGLCG
jgi:hypothetical protein